MTDMYENIGYRSIGPKYCINELLTRSTIEHRNNKLEKKLAKKQQKSSKSNPFRDSKLTETHPK